MNPAENVIFLALKRRSNCNCSVISSFLVILGNVAQKQHLADKESLGEILSDFIFCIKIKFLHKKLAYKISSFKINDISRIYTALS